MKEPIQIDKLTASDRGRLVMFTDPETKETGGAVLVNWNEVFLFLAWPNQTPLHGGPTKPENVRFSGDMRAVFAYRYGLRMRPPSIGAVPRGFIPDPSLTPRTADYEAEFRWGFLDYAEKLDDATVKSFELTLVGPVWRTDGTREQLAPEHPFHCCYRCGWYPVEGMEEYMGIHGAEARCVRCGDLLAGQKDPYVMEADR